MNATAAPDMERVRQAGLFDAALLAEMHRLIFTAPWDQPWSAESLAQILAMPGAAGWVLERGAEPIGFVLARFTLDEGEILLTGILPAARGQGCGGRLMQAAIAAARKAGVSRLFLEHAEPNQAAGALYRSLGFAPIGRRAGYYRAPGGMGAGGRAAGGRAADAITLALELPRPKVVDPSRSGAP
jgi:ribosomal-protein-alanine N-acetyltransferase